ncbi:DUF1659 domain-containing protein [Clostridium manihotivorum]|uniref:DUF1659 domain-containing protein n=1 Tax=Clostridium manihotivorum TaxID=2320868 RepID=A0A3R5QTS6_9CLOT|nr:DUF1659 domain-containing protein [Clostridium manihotivorum]QAA32127.1 hypothetical protein C1I91_10945 [Clostridium manihotivorum]
MATSILSNNSMIIKYKTGTNEKGDDIFNSQRFSDVRLDISDDDFYAVGKALAGLMSSDAVSIRKQHDYLVEDI